jgi:hypothetical protein
VSEFAWNGLRVNDRVIVRRHRAGVAQQAEYATVAFVNQHPRHNDVGVRIDGDADPLALWPTRCELHACP